MRTLPTVCVALVALLRSCKADSAVLTKPVGDEEATPAVLSAQLALTKVQLPLCTGVNDALPVTFSHPLADDPLTESFAVTVGNDTVEPTCATLAPANEANERQTVLLLGQFQTDTLEPTQVGIRGLSFTVNGSRIALAKDDRFVTPASTLLPVIKSQCAWLTYSCAIAANYAHLIRSRGMRGHWVAPCSRDAYWLLGTLANSHHCTHAVIRCVWHRLTGQHTNPGGYDPVTHTGHHHQAPKDHHQAPKDRAGPWVWITLARTALFHTERHRCHRNTPSTPLASPLHQRHPSPPHLPTT